MYELKTDGNIGNLLNKLSEIIKSLDTIPKNGVNPDYTYVTEKDVVISIRGKLAEKGIMLIPCMVDSSVRLVNNDGKTTTVVKVVMSYTFFDIENGANITTFYQGEGEDTLDKGIYKAITGCQKYALLKTFLIPTGNDPEEPKGYSTIEKDNPVVSKEDIVEEKKENSIEEVSSKPISTESAKKVYAMGKNHKKILEEILKKYGYNTTFQIKQNDYIPLVEELEKSIA